MPGDPELYDVDQFDPAPDPDLVCCICQAVLNNPVECPCRHVFCRTCIERWLQNRRNCPNCRERMGTRDLKPVLPLLQNVINRLTLKCKFRDNGCFDKIPLEIFSGHVASCDFEMVKCCFKKCSASVLRKLIKTHEEVDCDYRETKCKKDCRLLVPYKDFDSHNCVQLLKQHLADQKEERIKLHAEIDGLKETQSDLRKQVDELRQQLADRQNRRRPRRWSGSSFSSASSRRNYSSDSWDSDTDVTDFTPDESTNQQETTNPPADTTDQTRERDTSMEQGSSMRRYVDIDSEISFNLRSSRRPITSSPSVSPPNDIRAEDAMSVSEEPEAADSGVSATQSSNHLEDTEPLSEHARIVEQAESNIAGRRSNTVMPTGENRSHDCGDSSVETRGNSSQQSASTGNSIRTAGNASSTSRSSPVATTHNGLRYYRFMYMHTSSGYSPTAPSFSPTSISYSPTRPSFLSTARSCSPTALGYSPTGPSFSQTALSYSPTGPNFSPTARSYSPTLQVCTSTSPSYSPASPEYVPSSAYSTFPAYSPASPTYSPTSPIPTAISPSYAPASPANVPCPANVPSPTYIPIYPTYVPSPLDLSYKPVTSPYWQNASTSAGTPTNSSSLYQSTTDQSFAVVNNTDLSPIRKERSTSRSKRSNSRSRSSSPWQSPLRSYSRSPLTPHRRDHTRSHSRSSSRSRSRNRSRSYSKSCSRSRSRSRSFGRSPPRSYSGSRSGSVSRGPSGSLSRRHFRSISRSPVRSNHRRRLRPSRNRSRSYEEGASRSHSRSRSVLSRRHRRSSRKQSSSPNRHSLSVSSSRSRSVSVPVSDRSRPRSGSCRSSSRSPSRASVRSSARSLSRSHSRSSSGSSSHSPYRSPLWSNASRSVSRSPSPSTPSGSGNPQFSPCSSAEEQDSTLDVYDDAMAESPTSPVSPDSSSKVGEQSRTQTSSPSGEESKEMEENLSDGRRSPLSESDTLYQLAESACSPARSTYESCSDQSVENIETDQSSNNASDSMTMTESGERNNNGHTSSLSSDYRCSEGNSSSSNASNDGNNSYNLRGLGQSIVLLPNGSRDNRKRPVSDSKAAKSSLLTVNPSRRNDPIDGNAAFRLPREQTREANVVHHAENDSTTVERRAKGKSSRKSTMKSNVVKTNAQSTVGNCLRVDGGIAMLTMPQGRENVDSATNHIPTPSTSSEASSLRKKTSKKCGPSRRRPLSNGSESAGESSTPMKKKPRHMPISRTVSVTGGDLQSAINLANSQAGQTLKLKIDLSLNMPEMSTAGISGNSRNQSVHQTRPSMHSSVSAPQGDQPLPHASSETRPSGARAQTCHTTSRKTCQPLREGCTNAQSVTNKLSNMTVRQGLLLGRSTGRTRTIRRSNETERESSMVRHPIYNRLSVFDDSSESSDDSWKPDENRVDSDDTFSEELDSDSSYEVVVPKTIGQILDECARDGNDDSDDTWSPDSED